MQGVKGKRVLVRYGNTSRRFAQGDDAALQTGLLQAPETAARKVFFCRKSTCLLRVAVMQPHLEAPLD